MRISDWSSDVCSSDLILLVPNGSPFELGKFDMRTQLAVARVVESGLPLVYLNQIGGQDELVFDGASFVLNADRSLALQMPEIVRASCRERVCQSGYISDVEVTLKKQINQT